MCCELGPLQGSWYKDELINRGRASSAHSAASSQRGLNTKQMVSQERCELNSTTHSAHSHGA